MRRSGGNYVQLNNNVVLRGGGAEVQLSNTALFVNGSGISLGAAGGAWKNLVMTDYIEISEMTAPAAPGANKARLYVEDNGSGKTRLVVLFPSGAAQVLATEP